MRSVKKQRKRRSSSSGFTLIELLVVIAIISLLVSILLPSLQRAKELAKNVICMSNLKNLCLPLSYYRNDHDGILLPHSVSGQYWYIVIRPYLDESLKTNYLESQEVAKPMLCPSDETEGGLASKGASPYGQDDTATRNLRSYGLTGSLYSYLGFQRESDIPRPDSAIRMGDNCWWVLNTAAYEPANPWGSGGLLNTGNDKSAQFPENWHPNENLNLLLMSGCVVTHAVEDIKIGGDQEELWYGGITPY